MFRKLDSFYSTSERNPRYGVVSLDFVISGLTQAKAEARWPRRAARGGSGEVAMAELVTHNSNVKNFCFSFKPGLYRRLLIFVFWIVAIALSADAEIPTPLQITPFSNFDYENIEPPYSYGFSFPIKADILNEDPNTYQPDYHHRYFMSVFGPRYKPVTSSNIEYFDFHQGSDITAEVDYDGMDYGQNNPPDVFSMCDGEIDRIHNPDKATAEKSGEGRYVRVKCDQVFNSNPSWGPIYMAYRHLDEIDPDRKVNKKIYKGDRIGSMGSTGLTKTVHLHFSLRRKVETEFYNVHPMRAFDPTTTPHLLDYLQQGEIHQLEVNEDNALFRVALPYNQANIRAITVSLKDGSYQCIYDFEYVSETADKNERDHNDYVPGLELFAYPFNRGQTASLRYLRSKSEMPVSYPASPERQAGNFFPILSDGIFATPAYVLDVRAKDLPSGYDINDLTIEIIDIYGYGIKATGTSRVKQIGSHPVFSAISNGSDDAQEEANGEVDTSGARLELGDESGTNHKRVALRFTDLNLPQGATITRAYIQFTAGQATDDSALLTIRAEDSDSAQPFAETEKNLSCRMMTETSIQWFPEPWENVRDAGIPQRTPDLSALIQEVVSRQGWSRESALAFIISGMGKRVASSFENHNSDDLDEKKLYKAPFLYIEYSEKILDLKIIASEDDVEEHEDGSIAKKGTDLELCYDDYISSSHGLYGYQQVGLRFQNVAIPSGATITKAFVQFTADEVSEDAAEMSIYGEAADSAASFSYACSNISNRRGTRSSVYWKPESWTAIGQAGEQERTPNLRAIIQEIIDRPDWSMNNDIAIIFSGTGTRTAESFDGSPSGAPTLHVEFDSNQ